MRAMVANHTGSVSLETVPRPRLRPDEVLVAVDSYSVNRGGTFLLESPPPHWRPGKDVAVTVVELSPGLSGVTPGQRVVAHPESGGWAELVAVGVDRLARLPDDLSFTVAAALPLVRLVGAGRLHPEIGRIDDWTMTASVIDAVLNRRVRGKAILEVRP